MGEFFEEHGEGGDVKASRPENKQVQSGRATQGKTKVDMAPNHAEGVRDEPSHSGQRSDDR